MSRALMLKKLSLSAVALVLAVLAVEGFLRCNPQHVVELNNPYKYNKYVRLAGGSYMDVVPLRFDFRGYYARSRGEIRYHFTPEGARYAKRGPKPRGRANIVVVGDSLTFGFCLRYEDAWPTIAERLLRARGVDASVFNLARPANDTLRSSRSYAEVVDAVVAKRPGALRHRLVIYGLHLNDLVRFGTSKIINRVEHRESFWTRHFAVARFAVRRIETLTQRRENVRRIIARATMSEPRFRDNFAAIRALREDARRAGAKLLVVILPVLFELDDYPFAPIHERLRHLLAEQQIAALDVTRDLATHDAEALWILPYDQHPNEVATGIIARAVVRKLQADYDPLLRGAR